MTYTRKYPIHTDCQYHWAEKYDEYTKEEMRDIIMDLLSDIQGWQANMDSVKTELEDAREQYVSGDSDTILAAIDSTIDYLDEQASEFYSINL